MSFATVWSSGSRALASGGQWRSVGVGFDLGEGLLMDVGEIDPSFMISHRIQIEQVPEMYKVWRDKEVAVTKIVIDPWQDVITA